MESAALLSEASRYMTQFGHDPLTLESVWSTRHVLLKLLHCMLLHVCLFPGTGLVDVMKCERSHSMNDSRGIPWELFDGLRDLNDWVVRATC